MELNKDVRNIIETWINRYRTKCIRDEYRMIWHFFNDMFIDICPNPHGRCVMKYPNVTIHWFNGQKHRINNPAVKYANGTKYWYYEGRLHRPASEGPAIEWGNGDKEWYYKGKLHRQSSEGPAIEGANGYKAWYYHNQRHRPLGEGPAVEYTNGDKEYWEFGKRI